ncbi:hypothetical protein DK37_00630 [Halomonas sp. SUBG004]|nr:hypothetical protein DK37_00630 [Halomonas sp. SUBG004]
MVWQVEDSIGNLLNGISNVNAGDTAFGDDAIVNAQTVRVTGTTITQAQYEELLAAVGDALSLEAGENAARTTVTYADLAAAVSAQANGVLAPSDFYSITANTTYTNTNGALSVANALTEIETVKSILAGARNTLNFETVYEWSITDSASNILDAITTAVPEVLEDAENIRVASGGAGDNILAAEYDALVDGLGTIPFDYNEVAYTLAYVFDETNDTFAAPDDLADRFFFTSDVFEINDALGWGSMLPRQKSITMPSRRWWMQAPTICSSPISTRGASWIVRPILSMHTTATAIGTPPYVSDATLVEINDTAVITFEQYGILEQIPGFEIQSYTLEDAVGIYLEDNSGLATNYIIDTEQPYQAQKSLGRRCFDL